MYTFGQKVGKTRNKVRCLEILRKDGEKPPARGRKRGCQEDKHRCDTSLLQGLCLRMCLSFV